MDRADFIAFAFDFGIENGDAFGRAIANAECVLGLRLDAVVQGSREQAWMANVAGRHFLLWIIKNNLAEHDYSQAALRQKFQNPMELLKALNDEWEGMKKEIAAGKASFQVIGTGFGYDCFGRRRVGH